METAHRPGDPLWSEGRADAVDPYDALRGLARLKARLGLRKEPNDVSAGRYTILALTGAGGFGRVYRGYDPELQREVALKAISVAQSRAAEARRLARAEAQVMARLSHPNIVDVFDIFVAPCPGPPLGTGEGSDLFIVMPFVPGETLEAWVRNARPGHAAILDAYVQAARGLAAAHRAGLVHRDFKPTNAMRTAEGHVVVLDFGVATADAAGRGPDSVVPDDVPFDVTARSVHERQHGGTPIYMAPEQHAGASVTPATDIYAFGLSLWEALTGERPFLAPTVAEMARLKRRGPPPPAVALRGLYPILRRALQPETAERWPSMDAMLEALERRPGRRRLVVAAVGLTAVAVTAVALTGDERVDCSDVADAYAQRWASRRPEVVERLADLGLEQADRASLVAHVDAFVESWTVARCEPSTSGAASDCLDAAGRGLTARVDAATASPEGAQAAVLGRALWPVVAACNGVRVLDARPGVRRPLRSPGLGRVSLPTSPRLRRQRLLLLRGRHRRGVRARTRIARPAAGAAAVAPPGPGEDLVALLSATFLQPPCDSMRTIGARGHTTGAWQG